MRFRSSVTLLAPLVALTAATPTPTSHDKDVTALTPQPTLPPRHTRLNPKDAIRSIQPPAKPHRLGARVQRVLLAGPDSDARAAEQQTPPTRRGCTFSTLRQLFTGISAQIDAKLSHFVLQIVDTVAYSNPDHAGGYLYVTGLTSGIRKDGSSAGVSRDATFIVVQDVGDGLRRIVEWREASDFAS